MFLLKVHINLNTIGIKFSVSIMNISEFILSIPDFISNAVELNQWIGYAAIFLAMFLENVIPPIPSEIIMPLGGFYVSQGQLDFVPVVLSGVLGTLLGAYPWYGLGRLLNEDRLEVWLEKYGKWIGVSSQELSQSRLWFNKYGNALVFWGRLIPGIRTLISVPAGIELMPIVPFTIWTTAGSIVWISLLTIAGILLGESYSQIELWLSPFSTAIKYVLFFGLLSLFCWFGIRFFKKNRKS